MVNLAEECRTRGIRFIYDPSQQVPRLDGSELRRGIEGSYAMVVNGYESEVIFEKTGMALADLRKEIDILIITRGKQGSHIYNNGEVIEIPAFPARSIKDPTGGGDAYRAGFLCGLANGIPLDIAGMMGSLCATYVLENVGTQSHHFTVEEFIQRYRQHYDDRGSLERLLNKPYLGALP
jgi:adenosine kinase